MTGSPGAPGPTATILIVEDEEDSAASVRRGLAMHGFEADVAASGREGLRRALEGTYDLAILDVMLPDIDGWDVLAELRRAGRRLPVLILSAKDSVPDRVRGLDLGADDYLVKPFAFTELVARVRTILRRHPGAPDVLRVADVELDLGRQRVTRGGRRLDLTPKELALLTLFMRRPGEVLTRDVIAAQVWEDAPALDTNVIDVHIRRLRAKIDDPFEQKLLRTKRGTGYVMHAPVDHASSLDAVRRRFLGQVDGLLEELMAKAEALASADLPEAGRAGAEREAHKLVGRLGTLGMPDESRIARRIEEIFAGAIPDRREAPSLVRELRLKLGAMPR